MGLLNDLKKENNSLKKDLERKDKAIRLLQKDVLTLELKILIENQK